MRYVHSDVCNLQNARGWLRQEYLIMLEHPRRVWRKYLGKPLPILTPASDLFPNIGSLCIQEKQSSEPSSQ